MKISKRITIFIISIGMSVGLFYYLAETLLFWRIVFSVLLFLATYIMMDGFLRRT